MVTREGIVALFGALVECNLDMVHAVLARAPEVALLVRLISLSLLLVGFSLPCFCSAPPPL